MRRYLPDIAGDVLGAIVANQLTDLETPIASSCELTPVTLQVGRGQNLSSNPGDALRSGGAGFPGAKVMVGQSFGDGYFSTFTWVDSLQLTMYRPLKLK